MSKVCHFCGSKNFKNNKVQYIYKHSDRFLIVKDVPCLQCEYCGEQYFRGDVLEKIEKEFHEIYSLRKEVKKEFSVPVEHYTELQPAS
jgi:YgiT-type zinc finger domain-containing protein